MTVPITHNERLAGPRIDALPKLSGYQYKIFITLILGNYFEYFNFNATTFVTPALMAAWNMDLVTAGIVIASVGWGMIVGSLSGGLLSDFFGRRVNFMWALAVFSFFSILGGFSRNPLELIITRAIAGWGCGAEIDAINTYIQEFFPARMRGRLTTIGFGTGVGLSAFGDAAIWIFVGVPFGWPWVFWFGGICGLVVFILQFLWLEESPRWLQSQGRWEEAEKILTRIEKGIPEEKMAKFKVDVGNNSAKVLEAPVTTERLGVKDLLGKEYRRRTGVCWSLTFFAWMGTRSYTKWFTPLLMMMFGPVFGVLASLVPWIGSITGSLGINPIVTDRFGRKKLIPIASCVGTIFIFAMGVFFHKIELGGIELLWAVVLCGTLASACTAIRDPNIFTYVPEQFPTRARATAFATSQVWARISGDATAPIVAGWIMATYGSIWMFNQAAVAYLVAGLVVLFFGISTKGKTLEEISK